MRACVRACVCVCVCSKQNYGLGAKSQILSSVAPPPPPGRKSWLLFSVKDMPGGLRTPYFTKFSVVSFL